jgi:hypothetical protein
MTLRGDLEPIVLREQGIFFIAPGFGKSYLILLIMNIGDSFEEEEREYIGLEVSRINRPTQDVGGFPEM